MVDKQQIMAVVKPVLLGTAVIVVTPMLGGLLNSVLSFIPSTTIGGIVIPHTLLAAGAVAGVAGWIIDKYVK